MITRTAAAPVCLQALQVGLYRIMFSLPACNPEFPTPPRHSHLNRAHQHRESQKAHVDLAADKSLLRDLVPLDENLALQANINRLRVTY